MATISVNKTEVTITVGEQGPTGPMPVIVDGDGNIITYDDTAVRGLITGLTNDVSSLTTQVANLVLNGGGGSGGGETFDPTSILASIATLDQRMTSNTTAIATLAASIPAPFNPASLQTSINTLNTRIDNLPAPYNPAPLNTRMTAAEAAILVAQARADSAFALATGDGEVTEYDDTQVRQLIAANTQLIQALSTEIDELPVTEQYDDTAIQTRIDQVEASIPAPYNPTVLTNRVAAVETTVAGLPRFTDIPNAYDPTPLSTRLGAVESTLSGLTTTVAALEQVEAYDDTQLTNRVTAVETALVNIPDEYDDTALTNRISQNEALVATLPRFSDIPDAYDDSAINTRINEVEASIPEPYNDAPLLNTVNSFNSRITYLENTNTGGGSVNEMIAGTLPNPFVSARLGVLDSPTSRVFNNVFKQVLPWQSSNFQNGWADLVAGGHMTAGGQLISIMPGTNGFYTRAFANAPQVSGASGRYRLRWEGICTIDVNGVQNIIRDIPNQIWFDFEANGGSWVEINVRTIDSAGGQIRNISLVHEDDIAAFDAGEIFRRQYLETIRNMRVLRFDEWIGILRSTTDGGLRIDTWASRPLVTDEIYSYRFVPYEIMANLCNTVGADMWVVMPTAATLDHFEKAATLIQSLISEPRHVYVEYSTKTWDFAGTPQAHYTGEQGRLAFGTDFGNEFHSWYGMQSALLAQIWKEVWGTNNNRLHTVIQIQADWLGSEADILNSPLWRDADPARGLAPYVAPHSVIDMLTVHAQIDGGMAYGNGVTQIDNWRTTLSQNEAFNRMRDQMLRAQYFYDNTDTRDVDNMTMKWQYFKNVANTYGLEFGIYEIGNHLNGVGGSDATQLFVQTFSVSAQMGEVYTAVFNALRTLELDGPLCMSVEVRHPDANTAHGLQRWLGDYNLAWTAVNNLNQTLTGPSGRGAFGFVGSYELILGSGDGGVVPPTTTYDDTVIVGRINTIDAKLVEIEYLLRQIVEGTYTPAPIAPAQFGVNDWAVATGLDEYQIVFSINALPSDGGSAITAIEYGIGNQWTALDATTTGSYVVELPNADAVYNLQLRAVNAVDAGLPSDTKSARTAAVVIAYPALTANMLRPGEIPVSYNTSLPITQILPAWHNGVMTTGNPDFVTFNDDDSVDLRAEYIGSDWNSGKTQIIKPTYGMGTWEWIVSSTKPDAVLAMFLYDGSNNANGTDTATKRTEIDWEYGQLPEPRFGLPAGTVGFFITLHLRRSGGTGMRSIGVGFVPYSKAQWETPAVFKITHDQEHCRWFINDELVGEIAREVFLGTYPDALWVTNAKLETFCSIERHAAWAGPLVYDTANMKVWGVRIPQVSEQNQVAPSPWIRPVPTNGGPNGAADAFFRGVVTTVDGAYRVTTAAGSTNGRAAIALPAVGTEIVLESSIIFNNATRIIARQVINNDSPSGDTVFDVTRGAGQTELNRTDTFTVLANRSLLHFIGVTAAGQYFTINPTTRWRLASVVPPVEPEEPEQGTAARSASTSSNLKVHSGHSLVDTYINEGESFPGFLPELFMEQFGTTAWVFEGTDYKDTLPGSPMSIRWNDASDPRGAVAGIARYQTMVVTEGGPPFRLNAQNTAEYITATLEYAMNFAENAYRNGNNGNGAESILWSIWPNIYGWVTNDPQDNMGTAWRDLGGFRPVTAEYGRTFRYIADYVTWKMKQIHPELGDDYRMWMFPGHAWFVRVYDDIQAGLVPGITDHVQLFRDDIHPNPTCSYALSVFMHTMLYQMDARPLTYRPTFVPAPLDAYFKRVAWEIAISEESVGMGGTANAAPVFIGGTTPDPMPTYSFDGEVVIPPVDPEPTDPVDVPTNGLLHRLAAPVTMTAGNYPIINMTTPGTAGAPYYMAFSFTPNTGVRDSASIIQLLDSANNMALEVVERVDMERALIQTGFDGNHTTYEWVAADGQLVLEIFIDPALTPQGRVHGPDGSSTSDLFLTTAAINRIRLGSPDWGGSIATGTLNDVAVYGRIPTTQERAAIVASLA